MKQEVHTDRIPFDTLFIDRQEIYRALGYRSVLPERAFRCMVEEVCQELAPLCKPQGAFRMCKGVWLDSESVAIEEQVFHVGKIIAPCLEKAECFAVFVVTAGAEYEGYMEELNLKGDLLKVFMADAVGSVIAEACVNEVIRKMEAAVPMKHTYPYSPGYCGWNVKEQALLFALLPEKTCGVSLTDSCLMLPIKSVSGIIGFGKQVEGSPYGCAICNSKNCYKRRSGSFDSV